MVYFVSLDVLVCKGQKGGVVVSPYMVLLGLDKHRFYVYYCTIRYCPHNS